MSKRITNLSESQIRAEFGLKQTLLGPESSAAGIFQFAARGPVAYTNPCGPDLFPCRR